jgi:hypothetical protein
MITKKTEKNIDKFLADWTLYKQHKDAGQFSRHSQDWLDDALVLLWGIQKELKRGKK